MSTTETVTECLPQIELKGMSTSETVTECLPQIELKGMSTTETVMRESIAESVPQIELTECIPQGQSQIERHRLNL